MRIEQLECIGSEVCPSSGSPCRLAPIDSTSLQADGTLRKKYRQNAMISRGLASARLDARQQKSQYVQLAYGLLWTFMDLYGADGRTRTGTACATTPSR